MAEIGAAKKYFVLVVCFIEATVLAGALYGWPSLVYVLEEDYLYYHLCPTNNGTSIGPNTVFNEERMIWNMHLNNSDYIMHSNSSNPSLHSNSTHGSLQSNISHVSNGYSNYDSMHSNSNHYSIDSNSNHDSMHTNSNNEGMHNNSNYRIHTKRFRGCTEQKVQLSLSFTVAVVSFGITAFPIGLFFDKFGLRTTRTVAAILGLLTYFQLAIASPGTEWLLMTGAVGIGITSFALLLTSCHVTLLAGAKSSTVNAIIIGGINTSFAYEAVKVATEHGIKRMYGLLFIGAFWLMVLFSSWALLPPFKVNPKTLNNETEWEKEIKDSLTSKQRDSEEKPNMKSMEATRRDQNDRSLWRTVFSATFIIFLYWFAANNVRINMMTNGYHAWISEVSDNDHHKVSFYTDLLAYFTLAGTFVSPLAGYLTDYMRGKYASCPGGVYLINVPALALTSVLLIAVTVPLFFHNAAAVYSSIILFAFGKSYTYSAASIFVSLMCPPKYFGMMFGILHLVGGVTSAVMYPYLMWVSHVGSFLPVNTLILTSTVLTLTLPLWLLFKWRQSRQQCHSQKLLSSQKVMIAADHA